MTAIPNTTASTYAFTPTGEACPHCGKPLKTVSVTVFGKTLEDMPCACECGDSTRKADSGLEKAPTNAERYMRAGIGAEYRGRRMPCAEYVQAVKDGRNVFITGGNGSGKSTLAASVAMEFIDRGAKVRFVNAAIEAQAIKSGFGSYGADASERMMKVPVLVLDDLGKGNPTEWEATLWYSVAEARNAGGLPTIVTSNYDGGDLVKRLAAGRDDSTARAIVSRLRGGAVIKKMQGRDMRLFDPDDGGRK